MAEFVAAPNTFNQSMRNARTVLASKDYIDEANASGGVVNLLIDYAITRGDMTLLGGILAGTRSRVLPGDTIPIQKDESGHVPAKPK